MIEVHHLCKRYGNQKAVDDISFTIEKGHLVADDTPENLEKLFAGNTTIELTARAEDGEIREMLSFVSGIRTISCSAPRPGRNGEPETEVSIETDGNVDIREELFDAFASAGKKFIRLEQKKANLEDVFLELTEEEVKTNESHIQTGA